MTRRKALGLMMIGAVVPSALATNPPDYLWGTWVVRCPNGHDDIVTGGTAQHKCEKCGVQVFKDGKVTVVCPKGHANETTLHGKTQSVICKVADCKSECCRKKIG